LSDVGLNFDDTVKLSDLETPLFGATFGSSMSCINQGLANFVFKNHRLVTTATGVVLGQILTTPLNCLFAKPSFWCNIFASIFNGDGVIAVYIAVGRLLPVPLSKFYL